MRGPLSPLTPLNGENNRASKSEAGSVTVAPSAVASQSRAVIQADPRLNAVIIKACALAPGDGYHSAEEMHLDLALLHSGRSVKRKRALENQLAFIRRVAAMGGLAALLAAGAYFYQQHQTRLAEQAARQEIDR